jgi:hypothetical protein
MHEMLNVAVIDENEFVSLATAERCRACLSERSDAKSPTYRRYSVRADEFMGENVYPTWRTNKDRTEYIGSFETPPTDAFPIKYGELALLPNLFDAIQFGASKDYLASHNVIAFYCTSCGVRVVKDGNHRLLQCAVQNIAPEITVYEVVSNDWRKCQVDMKNFCKCISKETLIYRQSLTQEPSPSERDDAAADTDGV